MLEVHYKLFAKGGSSICRTVLVYISLSLYYLRNLLTCHELDNMAIQMSLPRQEGSGLALDEL